MTTAKYDVIAIGNAIMDVITSSSDDYISAQGMTKGGMTLINADDATRLTDDMQNPNLVGGGSAANTLVGMASLGNRCAFIGQVADDELGEAFRSDMHKLNIDFTTAKRESEPPTARCLIFVTPDGERTMNTFLGASQFLPAAALDAEQIASAEILYLEGYLWDPEEPRKAMRTAIDIARKAGRKVAFTLSDAFVIDRHRDDFLALLNEGLIDILFANHIEICSLAEVEDFDLAVAKIAEKTPLLVVTKGAEGAIAVQEGNITATSAQKVDNVVDTTGAGDLFAAGFLSGLVKGKDIETALRMGTIAGAEIISQIRPRPQCNLEELIAKTL